MTKPLELGEVSQHFTATFEKELEEVINQNTHRSEYYILVTANRDFSPDNKVIIDNEDPNKLKIIRTKIFIIPKEVADSLLENDEYIEQLSILNTALFYVNNKKALFQIVHILPMDMPLTQFLPHEKDQSSRVIYESIKGSGIPLLYS